MKSTTITIVVTLGLLASSAAAFAAKADGCSDLPCCLKMLARRS